MNELNEQLSVKSTIDNVLLESLCVSEEINSIQGETTLYGQVEKIESSPPKIWLMLNDNETIMCEIKESLAIELANYLYQWVSVFGQAKWNSSNRFFPSSQLKLRFIPNPCSNCGEVKKNLTLEDRIYSRDSCVFEIDRDLNAAINLNNYAV